MSPFHPFRCAECGTEVELAHGPGRTEEYRPGIDLPIPDDFVIPACPACGELYFTVELSDQLQERLAPVYAQWKRNR